MEHRAFSNKKMSPWYRTISYNIARYALVLWYPTRYFAKAAPTTTLVGPTLERLIYWFITSSAWKSGNNRGVSAMRMRHCDNADKIDYGNIWGMAVSVTTPIKLITG